ncbi:TPA: recombinase family protein [Escherichia coli]|nr:recombinase family protein [Escherichia coli]
MSKKTFAYIRVSSKDQNEARQLEEIKALGICRRQVKIYIFCLFAFYTSAENTLFRCFIR